MCASWRDGKADSKGDRETRDTKERDTEARERGCNAVVGVDIDYENVTVGSSGSMLMVSASGTAVVVR